MIGFTAVKANELYAGYLASGTKEDLAEWMQEQGMEEWIPYNVTEIEHFCLDDWSLLKDIYEKGGVEAISIANRAMRFLVGGIVESL